MCSRITHRHSRGASFSIVVVAEGATPAEGTMELASGELDEFGHVRLGGMGNRVADEIERRTGFEARVHQPRARAARRQPDRVRPRHRDPVRHRSDRCRDTKATSASWSRCRGTDVVRVPIEAGVEQLKTVDQKLYDTAAVFFG